MSQWQKKELVERTCPVCGETFETKVANKKYCTPECAGVARRSKETERSRSRRQYHTEWRKEQAEQRERDENVDPAFATNDPWLNLVYAVMLDAHEAGDEESVKDYQKLALALGGATMTDKERYE